MDMTILVHACMHMNTLSQFAALESLFTRIVSVHEYLRACTYVLV